MKVVGCQKLAFTSGQPAFARLRLALRAVPVTAGVVRDGLMAALRTGIDMAAQRSRAAALNRPKGFELLKVEALVIPVQKAATLCAKDVGHLHGGPAHALAVDVLHAKPDQFAAPHTGRVQCHEDGARLKIAGVVDELGHFLRA